jgi:hypothetical protein
MPDGLFNKLKEGVLGIFQGPQDPRVPQGTGTRESLIHAGLATMASDDVGMQAVAQGIMQGREMGMAVQQFQVKQQQQAALAAFLQEAGYDRKGLTSVFMRVLASGDLESAKAVSEVLKSLPDEKQETPYNRQMVPTVVSTAAGAPPDVVQRLGEGTPVRIQMDPRTGQQFWNTAVPEQPPTDPYAESFVEPNPQSPTGAFRIGIRRDTGQREVIGLANPPAGAGGGGAQERINRNLAEAMKQANEALGPVDASLADPIVGAIANMSNAGGVIGYLARGALSVFPDAQLAAGARERWVAPAVRLMSGAQMTEQERQTYRVAYTTQPYDAPELQRQKAVARATLATLFADDPDALQSMPRVQARELLNTVMSEAGMTPVAYDPAFDADIMGGPGTEGYDPEFGPFKQFIPGGGGS